MASIAFVGVDGAGKTTLAKNVGEQLPFPTKYMYMGLSTLKSEPAFITTKIIRYWKLRSLGVPSHNEVDSLDYSSITRDYHYKPGNSGHFWVILRKLNYLVDVLYRLLFSFYYQLDGNLVVFDRDFLFMSAPEFNGNEPVYKHWTDRFLYWIFNNIYPKPGMVFFLDAPPELLYDRRKEEPVDYLRKRRTAIIEQGKKTKNFITIDSTQPLDVVMREVHELIMSSEATRRLRKE